MNDDRTMFLFLFLFAEEISKLSAIAEVSQAGGEMEEIAGRAMGHLVGSW